MNIIKKTILLLCLIFSISTKVGAQKFNEFVLTYGSTVENFGNVHLLGNKKSITNLKQRLILRLLGTQMVMKTAKRI